MKLRYTVEGNFSATFTSTIKVRDETQATMRVMALRMSNYMEKYKKYSNFILYDDENKIIKRL